MEGRDYHPELGRLTAVTIFLIIMALFFQACSGVSATSTLNQLSQDQTQTATAEGTIKKDTLRVAMQPIVQTDPA